MPTLEIEQVTMGEFPLILAPFISGDDCKMMNYLPIINHRSRHNAPARILQHQYLQSH